MLPYTPLHHLLLAGVGGRPLVMTSGNLSDEPIATDNAEALARLAPLADAFLLHDRAILSRYDDSVLRVVGDRIELVRRSRGYAPFPLTLPFETDTDILAAGPEQKNTFTLLTGGYAFVSQHIGDMENAETLASYAATVELYERLFRIEPETRRVRPASRVPLHQVGAGPAAAQGRRPAPPRAHRERDRRARHRREGRGRRVRRHRLRRGRPHLGRRGAHRRLGGLRAVRPPRLRTDARWRRSDPPPGAHGARHAGDLRPARSPRRGTAPLSACRGRGEPRCCA